MKTVKDYLQEMLKKDPAKKWAKKPLKPMKPPEGLVHAKGYGMVTPDQHAKLKKDGIIESSKAHTIGLKDWVEGFIAEAVGKNDLSNKSSYKPGDRVKCLQPDDNTWLSGKVHRIGRTMVHVHIDGKKTGFADSEAYLPKHVKPE